MNAKELYLAWLRTNYPTNYVAALRKAVNKPRSLGGLGDDLLSTFTAPDFTSTASDIAVTPDVTAAIDAGVAAGGNWFDTFITGVQNVASTYLNTQAQSNLLNINTQRIKQGLPPVNNNGVPVTAAQLAPANSAVYRMERQIAGTLTQPNTLMLLAAAGVGVALLARRR